jgi:hypothetical protein
LWPIVGGFARLAIAIGGGVVALKLTGSLDLLFAILAASLIVYGVSIFAAVRSTRWIA